MPDIFASMIVLGTFYLIIYKFRKKKEKVLENKNLKFEI